MANEEIDAILNGEQQQPQPQPKPEPDLNVKVGQLVNELSESRKAHDVLRAELEALRASQVAPQHTAQGNVVEEGWNDWSKKIVNEIPDDEWLTNPKEAYRKGLVRAGKDLAQQARDIATNTSYQVGSALQMDSEFNNLYPDLGTDMGRVAQQQAIAELAPNAKFQQLMRLPATRKQALAAVAKLSRQKLGMSEESTRVLDDVTEGIPQRKSVFAAPSGIRPGGRQIADDDAQDKAMTEMIDFQKARS